MRLGYLLDMEETLCALCSINVANPEQFDFQEIDSDGYPDGFTCARCGEPVRNPYTQDTEQTIDSITRTASLNIGAEICRSLGLNPNNIVGFTLEFRAGALPNLTVIHQAWQPNLEAFSRQLTNYLLLPKP